MTEHARITKLLSRVKKSIFLHRFYQSSRWKMASYFISDLCLKIIFVSVQFSRSVVSDPLRPHGLQQTRPPCPSPTPGPTQTHVHWVSDAIQPSRPLSSPSPPTFNLSQQQGLSNESVLHITYPKYWSFSFSLSPSNEYSGLISFRMDCLDLLAVQALLK